MPTQIAASTSALWQKMTWKRRIVLTLWQKSGIRLLSRTSTLTNTQTLTEGTDLMTKKYFPNNYDKVKAAPAHWFPPIAYEDFMDWKIDGWELPTSHDCIIRTINCKTGKIKEYVYQQHKSAKKKVAKLIVDQEEEFIIAGHDFIQHMKPAKYLTENEKKELDSE